MHTPSTLLKTITFALVHFCVAFSVAYLLTGSVALSSALALLEPLVNTFAYYLHERVRDGLRRGREPGQEGTRDRFAAA